MKIYTRKRIIISAISFRSGDTKILSYNLESSYMIKRIFFNITGKLLIFGIVMRTQMSGIIIILLLNKIHLYIYMTNVIFCIGLFHPYIDQGRTVLNEKICKHSCWQYSLYITSIYTRVKNL